MLSITSNNLIKSLFVFFTLLAAMCTPRFADAQCPANPVGATPNDLTSTMPSEIYFCEGINSVVIDAGLVSSNRFSINYRWYKYNTSTNNWDNLNLGNQGSITLSNNNTDLGRYAVCWQKTSTGDYKSAEIEVKEKSFSDQLVTEQEFVLPGGANQVFTCSNQPVQPFTTKGIPNYTYSWTPTSFFANYNIKNAVFELTPNSYNVAAKGSSGTSEFSPTLRIEEIKSGCVVTNPIKMIIYPFLGPEFANLSDVICQNNLVDPEVRVFMINGYSIQSATVKVGNNPAVTYNGTDFVSTNASALTPQQNTLGRNDVPLTGTTKVQVLKFPLSTSQIGKLPVAFDIVTDK
jgi:hypothetical protein